MFKSTVKSILRSVGIKRNRKPRSSKVKLMSSYHAAILGVASVRPVHVVVVGANDGKHNDPCYEILMGALKQNSVVTLIEPQKVLLPYIESNFATHPNAKVINAAIGAGDEIALYSIDEAIWEYTQPTYAQSWPIYRAPTGITSSDRQSVINWGSKNIAGKEWKDEYAVESNVPSFELKSALLKHGREHAVDILQIDAEGYDDIVLRSSNLEEAQPSLIRFEAKLLSADRLESINTYLSKLGYYIVRDKGDCMAFHTKQFGA